MNCQALRFCPGFVWLFIDIFFIWSCSRCSVFNECVSFYVWLFHLKVIYCYLSKGMRPNPMHMNQPQQGQQPAAHQLNQQQQQQQQQQPHPQQGVTPMMQQQQQQPHPQGATPRPITIWQGVMEYTEVVRG